MVAGIVEILDQVGSEATEAFKDLTLRDAMYRKEVYVEKLNRFGTEYAGCPEKQECC